MRIATAEEFAEISPLTGSLELLSPVLLSLRMK